MEPKLALTKKNQTETKPPYFENPRTGTKIGTELVKSIGVFLVTFIVGSPLFHCC